MIVTLLGLDNFIMYILTINHTIVKRSSEIIRYIFILVDCMDLLSGTSEQRFLKFKLSCGASGAEMEQRDNEIWTFRVSGFNILQ